MEGKEEDVRLGANKFSERQPIGTAAQGAGDDKDYKEPPPAALFEPGELKSWSFYRAGIAEFVATFLFIYITILTAITIQLGIVHWRARNSQRVPRPSICRVRRERPPRLLELLGRRRAADHE